jgi:hypothetical protein
MLSIVTHLGDKNRIKFMFSQHFQNFIRYHKVAQSINLMGIPRSYQQSRSRSSHKEYRMKGPVARLPLDKAPPASSS